MLALIVLILLRQGAKTTLEPTEKFPPREGTTIEKEIVLEEKKVPVRRGFHRHP